VTELLLGDATFGRTDLVTLYAQEGGWLLTPGQLPVNPAAWQHALYAYRRETIKTSMVFLGVCAWCRLTLAVTKA
jgi:hypothetical protein